MKIGIQGDQNHKRQTLMEHIRLAHALGPVPDPVCAPDCSDYRQGKECHRDCEYAPKYLSSEKEEYPLEPLITPLVFELKKLGVFHPCWSCEGHNDRSGKLWKLPRIWFYSDSVVHVRALSAAVSEINRRDQLACHWQVVVTYSDNNNFDTTFSLEPGRDASNVSLSNLQNDLRKLSTHLAEAFNSECVKLSVDS